jgi:hypothetical protein
MRKLAVTTLLLLLTLLGVLLSALPTASAQVPTKPVTLQLVCLGPAPMSGEAVGSIQTQFAILDFITLSCNESDRVDQVEIPLEEELGPVVAQGFIVRVSKDGITEECATSGSLPVEVVECVHPNGTNRVLFVFADP